MKSKRAREATEVDEKPVVSVDAEAPAKKRKREDDGAEVKKAKKEKRDKKYKKESRKERKEKRKDLQDLPEQDDDVEDAQDTPMAGADDKPADTTVDAEKSAKKDKKKEKKAKVEEEQQDASADAETKDESKKSKKNKKKQNKSAETSTANDESASAEADTADANTNGKADRHIVFVGNLPFTATAETIKAHFASLNPVGVRCMSDPKDSKPCRGFAFVEFAKVWHMRTCLDKFHHSEFSDGTSYPRRINVELT
jgi:nucleolar protein 6